MSVCVHACVSACACVCACVTGWGGAGEAGGSHRSLPPPAATLPGQRVARGRPWRPQRECLRLDPAPADSAWSTPRCVLALQETGGAARGLCDATDVLEVAFPLTGAILSLRFHTTAMDRLSLSPSVEQLPRTRKPWDGLTKRRRKKTVLIF